MTDKIYRILKIVCAVATLFLLAALALQCVSMYVVGAESADPAFTADKVAAALVAYVPYCILYVFFVVATVFVGRKIKYREKLPGLFSDNRLRLAKKRFSQLPVEAMKEEKLRRRIMVIYLLIISACVLPCILYMTDAANFESWELEGVISQLVMSLVPWIVAVFIFSVVASILSSKSMEREIEILKRLNSVSEEKTAETVTKEQRLMLPRILIITASLVLIFLGIMNGGSKDVFIKAINICTECIGLG